MQKCGGLRFDEGHRLVDGVSEIFAKREEIFVVCFGRHGYGLALCFEAMGGMAKKYKSKYGHGVLRWSFLCMGAKLVGCFPQ